MLILIPAIGNGVQVLMKLTQVWLTDDTLKKKKFQGSNDTIIMESYFKANHDSEPLIGGQAARKKHVFLTDISLSDSRVVNKRKPSAEKDKSLFAPEMRVSHSSNNPPTNLQNL